MIETPWGVWDAFSPAEIVPIFEGLDVPWWIAGGYAIEAFGGRTFREHGDVDISVFREDQMTVRAHLQSWDVHAADPPGTLRPWPTGEELPLSVHDIWVREVEGGPWRFQLMINESLREADQQIWISRRNPRIRRPLDETTWVASGIRYLAPEVQLHFKAKGARPKDELDFAAALPLLDAGQRSWLHETIALDQPDHPWLIRLS